MSERAMRQRLVNRVLRRFGAFSVENSANPGTPDVACCLCWLELKQVRRRPVHTDSIVRVDHFTQEQRVFIEWMVLHGHQVWVVLQLEKDWFVLPPLWAAEHLGKCPELDLLTNAARYWKGRLDEEELCTFLTSAQVSDFSSNETGSD